jgi:hypothetical protein
MGKPMPKAGRAPQTAGHQRPPLRAGATEGGGKMRDRGLGQYPSSQDPETDAPEPQGGAGS